MFVAVSQQMSYLSSSINRIQSQVNAMKTELQGSNPSVNESQLTQLDDVVKNVSKMQVDVSIKHAEQKRELEKLGKLLEQVQKEQKVLETTLTLKTEQIVGKIVKERLEQNKEEMIDYILNKLTSRDVSSPSFENVEVPEQEEEDYEINVTLSQSAENVDETVATTPAKKRGRKPKAV